MHADVTGQVFKAAGQVEQFADGFAIAVAFHHLAQLRLLLECLGQRHRLVLNNRNQLGNPVAHRIRQAEHAADVADHRLRRHGAEGGNLTDRILAVVLADVLDDAPAVVLAEVDVEVGHRYPFRIQEALEQQGVGQRIEVGDAQAVGDQRTGAGTPARPDRHAVVLGPVDEVGHDQEVTWEAHLQDGLALEDEALVVFRPALGAHFGVRIQLGEANLQPFLRLIDEIFANGHARRDREIGQEVLAQRHRDVATLGNFQRVFQRLRQIGEQLRHLGLRLEILFLGVELRPPRIAQHVAFGNADARFVGAEVVTVHELDRMRRDQRNPRFAGQIGRLLNDGLLLRLAVALHFQIERAGENRLPGLGPLAGQIEIAVQQRFANIPEMRSGQGDQPVAANLAKPVAVQFSPVTPAFDQISLAQQLAQLLVTGVVARQQQQAISIVRRLRIGDPDIRPGNRLDPLAARPGIELDQPEQIAQIGQSHRRHAIPRRALDGITDADNAVGD